MAIHTLLPSQYYYGDALGPEVTIPATAGQLIIAITYLRSYVTLTVTVDEIVDGVAVERSWFTIDETFSKYAEDTSLIQEITGPLQARLTVTGSAVRVSVTFDDGVA